MKKTVLGLGMLAGVLLFAAGLALARGGGTLWMVLVVAGVLLSSGMLIVYSYTYWSCTCPQCGAHFGSRGRKMTGSAYQCPKCGAMVQADLTKK